MPWVDLPGGSGMWEVMPHPYDIPAGTEIQVRIFNLPVPATCWMSVTYANGYAVTLGTKTAVYFGPVQGSIPDTYDATWSWTVPANAALGIARLTDGCSWLGITRFESWRDFTVTTGS
jgi:hypothetical protein